MARKKAWKTLPDDLKSLQKEGERIRFNGFWLDEDDRDRVIAKWIEDQKHSGNNVSELVKNLIYDAATQRRRPNDEVIDMLSEIRDMLRSGTFVQPESGTLPPAEEVDDLLNNLRGMGT